MSESGHHVAATTAFAACESDMQEVPGCKGTVQVLHCLGNFRVLYRFNSSQHSLYNEKPRRERGDMHDETESR